MADIHKRYVTPKESIIYGVANGGQCMSYTFLCSYITYFFVNVFNIDKKAVSAMLFIEGIWDTVNDPLMGSVVDRTRTRYGKLRPYLLGVPIPLAITTLMLFAGPLIVSGGPKSPQKIIYMVITYFLWEFFYTICDVPFWGLSAAISPNPDDRTRAITSARFISSIFNGVPGIIMPILIDLSLGGKISSDLRTVFFLFSAFTGIAGMGLFSLSGIAVKERVVQSSDEPSFKECIKGLFTNRPLRILIIKELLSSLGGIGGTFSTYYYVDVLGSASVALIAGIPSTVMSFVSYFFLGIFRKFMNNKQMIIMSKIAPAVLGTSKYFIGRRHMSSVKFILPLFMIEGALSAVFSGINSVIPMEMVGETVDYAEYTSGKRTEGVSFSVMTFVGKFSNAISRSFGTLMLDTIGYKTSNSSAAVAQSDTTKSLIWALFTVVPSVLGLGGVIPMLFYDLVGKKREDMYEALALRRAECMSGESPEKADADITKS